MDKVERDGEVVIPHDNPYAFRGYFQSFLRVLEKASHPRAEQGKTMMVRLSAPGEEKGVIICNRDKSPHAQAVAKALGDFAHSVESAADALASRLEGLVAST